MYDGPSGTGSPLANLLIKPAIVSPRKKSLRDLLDPRRN